MTIPFNKHDFPLHHKLLSTIQSFILYTRALSHKIIPPLTMNLQQQTFQSMSFLGLWHALSPEVESTTTTREENDPPGSSKHQNQSQNQQIQQLHHSHSSLTSTFCNLNFSNKYHYQLQSLQRPIYPANFAKFYLISNFFLLIHHQDQVQNPTSSTQAHENFNRSQQPYLLPW